MRVLVVNQYVPPDTSATAQVFRDLVAALAGPGHEVTVLAGRPSYQPAERRPWRPLARERLGQATVERVGSAELGRTRLASRLVTYATYLLLAGLRGLTRPRPDVVVAGTDPPLAVWVALAAARGRPVVYSLQDLHPDVALASGMVRPGLSTRLWDRLHVAALRRCAVVVCLSQAMADRVTAKGVPADRVEVVPNGAPAPIGEPDPHVVAELRGGADFVVVHGGNLGEASAWSTLAQAAGRLADGTTLRFVGAGPHADAVRAAGAEVRPFLPAEQLASVMAAGDLQVVSLRRGLEGTVLPSKLYTILAHGRPVLAVAPPDGELAGLVTDHGCGMVADPDDPDTVVEAIAWARDHPDELAAMAQRAAELGRRYERGALTGRYVQLVERAGTRDTSRAHGHPRSR